MAEVRFTISAEAAKALQEYYVSAKIPTRPIRRAPESQATDAIQTMVTDSYNYAVLLRRAEPGETIEQTILRWASEPLTTRKR